MSRWATSLACVLLLLGGCGRPGAFRPCERTEFGRPDYERFVDQEVVVQLTGGQRIEGVLDDVDCEAGTLTVLPSAGGPPVRIQGREVASVRARLETVGEATGGVFFIVAALTIGVAAFFYALSHVNFGD